MWRNLDMPDWLADKVLAHQSNFFNFEGKLRKIDDHVTIRSWTWSPNAETVREYLEHLVKTGQIARYIIKIERAWTSFGTGKLSDFF